MAISTQNITQYIKDTESNILKTTSQNGLIAHATDTLKFFIARDGGWVGYDPVARHGSYTLPDTAITVPGAATWHFDASVGSSLRTTGGPIDSNTVGSVYEWQSIAGAPIALRAQHGTASYDPAGITGDQDSNTYPCVNLPENESMLVGQWSTPRIIKGDYTLFVVFRPNWAAYEGYQNIAGPDYQYRTNYRDFFHGALVNDRASPGSQLTRFSWYQQWNEDRVYFLPGEYYSNSKHIITINASTTKPGETANTQRVDDRPHIFTYNHTVSNNLNNSTTRNGHLYHITPRSTYTGYMSDRLGGWSSDCPAIGYNSSSSTLRDGGFKYCELLQLEGRLTLTQINTIKAHLANKWGTYVTPNMST